MLKEVNLSHKTQARHSILIGFKGEQMKLL